jgi:hypothetical protein
LSVLCAISVSLDSAIEELKIFGGVILLCFVLFLVFLCYVLCIWDKYSFNVFEGFLSEQLALGVIILHHYSGESM